MTADEILQRTTGPDFQRVRAALVTIAQKWPNKFKYVQIGNTLFITAFRGDGTVSVSMETTDTPRALMHAMMAFGKSLQQQGATAINFQVQNPAILRMLSVMGVAYHRTPGGFTIDLRK